MDIKKASTTLAKISNLQKTFSYDPDNISSIERDLMLSYLKDLYELYKFSDGVKQNNATPPSQKIDYKQDSFTPPAPPTVQKPAPTLDLPDHEKKAYEELSRYAPSEEARKNPRVIQTKAYEAPPARVKEEPVYQAPKYEEPPAPKHIEKERATSKDNDNMTDLFEQKRPNDLSERLSLSPILDLTKAMGINEKILNINELFNGDQKAFDQALAKLNSFDNYKEAKKYMSSELAPKYEWSLKERAPKAQQFVNLVKRRYT